MKDKVRVRGAYTVSTISVALVLFLIGSALQFYLNVSKATGSVIDNLKISLVLENSASQENIDEVKDILDGLNYVSKSVYISKEQALKDFSTFIDEDLITSHEMNPLPAVYTIYFTSGVDRAISTAAIKSRFKEKKYVDELLVQTKQIDTMINNLRSLNVIIIVFGAVLMFISIMLIRNSIKAHIATKKFIIKTMQLIGATAWFIRRPFIGWAIFQGVLASVIAYVMLSIVIHLMNHAVPMVELLSGLKYNLFVFGTISVIGILLCVIMTNIAVGKYLRSNNDKLHIY